MVSRFAPLVVAWLIISITVRLVLIERLSLVALPVARFQRLALRFSRLRFRLLFGFDTSRQLWSGLFSYHASFFPRLTRLKRLYLWTSAPFVVLFAAWRILAQTCPCLG